MSSGDGAINWALSDWGTELARGKRIDDLCAVDNPAVLQILAEQHFTAGFNCRGDDQCVVERITSFFLNLI